MLRREVARTIVVLALCGQGALAWAKEPVMCSSEERTEAVDVLREKVRAEGLYADWANDQCLWYYVEICDSVKADIAVRERHTKECGGDPLTGPVVDRFRVYKKSKKIEWYYAIDGEYLEFVEIRSIRSR